MSTQEIPLKSITISDDNPRKHFNQDSLEDLAGSIEKHGILQPILVRPTPGGDTAYELVSGERRYRASKIAGKDSIPALIRQMSDEEAFEARCVENLQREDVHPMDEARGYQHMTRTREMNPVEIAERMDKSVSYVVKRLKMNDLIEPLVEKFYEGELKIGHALELCRLPEGQQQELYEVYFKDPEAWEYMPTVNSLQETISRQYMLQMDAAIFDPEDEDLYPEAGPCTTCPKRSGNAPSLFPELEGHDRCTDKGCYQMKENLHLISLIERYKDDPNYYFITRHSEPGEGITKKLAEENLELIETNWQMTSVSEEECPTRGIYVAGHDAGDIVPFDPKGGSSNGNLTKAEREELWPREKFLEYEIDRIEERRARKQELDREKIQKAMVEQLQENEAFVAGEHPQKKLRLLATCWALYEAMGWEWSRKLKAKWGLIEATDENDMYYGDHGPGGLELLQWMEGQSEQELQDIHDQLITAWLMDHCTSQSEMDYGKWASPYLMRLFGQAYIPDALGEIEDEQNEKAEAREARYDERVTEMQKELAEIREEDGEYPEAVQQLLEYARQEEITLARQEAVIHKLTGKEGLMFQELTGDEATQVLDHLQGELAEEES